MTVDSGYADFFGPQVPRTGDEAQTATFALASAAYRDNPVEEILKANNEWHESAVKGGRSWAKIFRPNLGEAFSTAVITRMLGKGRKPLIQSFGAEPQVVVEHCLAANNIRRDRDNWLTAVMVLCGVLFLPGLLVWLLVFTLRTTIARREDKQAGALGTALLVAMGALAVLFLIKMPFDGFWALVRTRVRGPPRRRLVLGQADLRAHREGPAGALGQPAGRQQRRRQGARGGAEQPRRDRGRAAAPVPGDAQRRAAVQLRLLRRPQGNTRHGHPVGQLAARRGPGVRRPDQGDPPLPQLGRHPLHPRPAAHAGAQPDQHRRLPEAVRTPLGRHPDRRGREGGVPARGTDVDAYQVKTHAIQDICNKQQFGGGDRHYLGVQWTLWDGQLVITMLITVTVLHETLRIEVTGHALGPVHGLFTSKPAAKEKEVAKSSGSGRPRRSSSRWSTPTRWYASPPGRP